MIKQINTTDYVIRIATPRLYRTELKVMGCFSMELDSVTVNELVKALQEAYYHGDSHVYNHECSLTEYERKERLS